jgi:hypothetical protein
MLSESGVQSRVLVNTVAQGFTLFRNNVGVLRNPETGQPVRYGLANDSPQINRKWKSGDLIGWRRIVVTPDMVGQVLAVFVSRECKPEGWQYRGDEHELAQANWARLVNEAGGDACFVASPNSFLNPSFEARFSNVRTL